MLLPVTAALVMTSLATAAPLHGAPAPRLVETIEAQVRTFVGAAPAADDVTMLALARV